VEIPESGRDEHSRCPGVKPPSPCRLHGARFPCYPSLSPPPAEVLATNFDEHISEDAIEQYAMETLPQSEIEPLEMHLLVCEACQDRLTRIDQFIAALRAVARKNVLGAPGERGSALLRSPAESLPAQFP